MVTITVKKLRTIIFNHFLFFRFFLYIYIFFIFDFLITSKPKPRPFLAMAYKFSPIEFTVKISSKSITSNSVIFNFLLFWVILTQQFFFLNLKLRVRYFFATFYNILRKKNQR